MAERKEIIIQSRIGEVSVPHDRVLHFPRGVIGFEDRRRFTLLQIREDSPFMILQSMTDPGLGFLVTDPYSFMTEYEVVIPSADLKVLKIDDRRKVAILVTVVIPSGAPEKTTLNLTGPIVINSGAQIGLQILQTDSKYPSHFTPGMTPPLKNKAPRDES